MSTLVRTNRQLKTRPPTAVEEVLNRAGVQINGGAPWDIQIHDPATFERVLRHGSLGFGEAYMDGMWDAQRLDQLFYRLLRCDIPETINGWVRWRLLADLLRHRMFNLQSPRRAFQVGQRHYDLGSDVFEAMLDSRLNYSCAYWPQAKNLEQAQIAKLDLVCRKLALRAGERLLDIGCGWGSLARHAAQQYGVEVTGVTISREQLEKARAMCTGLPVQIELLDYRKLEGKYDKIASIGMFEHVGPRNYQVYFDTISRLMKDDALFLLHSIGGDRTQDRSDPWINRYIFPNGHIPSARQVATVLEGQFLIEDWHNFGADYDRTLLAWWDNFNTAWPRIKPCYDQRFYRMWKYYLLSCAGWFRAKRGQLWQLVLSKRSRRGIYRSVR